MVNINKELVSIIADITSAKGKAKAAVLESTTRPDFDPNVSEALKQYILLCLNPSTTLYQTLDPELKAKLGPFASRPKFPELDGVDSNLNIIPMLNMLVAKAEAKELGGDKGKVIFRACYNILNEENHILLDLFILRNLKAGFGATSVNKVIPKLVPIAGYMRCESGTWEMVQSIISTQGRVYAQEKHDGMFINIKCTEGYQVEYITREGNKLKSRALDDVTTKVKSSPCWGLVLHGECLVYDNGVLMPRAAGNGLLNSIIQTGEDLGEQYEIRIKLWDAVPIPIYEAALNNKETEAAIKLGKQNYSDYQANMEALHSIFGSEDTESISVTETWEFHSIEAVKEKFLEVLRRQGEGLVIKEPFFSWFNGTSKSMLKFKAIVESDFIMVSVNDGDKNGKYANMVGSVNFESSDGLIKFGCAGIKDDFRAALTKNPDDFIGHVYAVRFSEVIPASEGEGYSLTFPRIISEKRLDKQEADSYEEVLENVKNQLGL